MDFEEAGFHAAEALKPPGGDYDLLDQRCFDGADGMEVIFVGVTELGKVLIAFD